MVKVNRKVAGWVLFAKRQHWKEKKSNINTIGNHEENPKLNT